MTAVSCSRLSPVCLALPPSAGCALRPAQRRGEIRDRKDRCGMARAADAAAIRDPAQAGHRAPGLEPAAQGASQGHLRLRRLRPAAVLLGDEIRERHRLAELLSAAGKRRRQDRGPHLRDAADRNSLPPLRRPSRPRLRRRAEADRPALLHGRLCAGVSSGRARPSANADLRGTGFARCPAIVARPAIVPRSSDRGFCLSH